MRLAVGQHIHLSTRVGVKHPSKLTTVKLMDNVICNDGVEGRGKGGDDVAREGGADGEGEKK